MGMQVTTAHEASLSGMSMDPTQYHQVLRIAIVKERALVDSLTRVARTLLLWNDKPRDEKRVGDESTTKNAAGLQVCSRVRGCDG